ncbi:MAG: CDP-glycerol glycerophosphotransferase family protein, partial [Vicinamibacterales bacterium]
MSLLRTLRRIGWRGTRQVLVDSRTPVNYEMVRPVVRTMAADPRVRFACTASQEPGLLRRIYRDADAGCRLVSPARAALMKWDAYLTSDFMWAVLPRGAPRVQMFHGVAGKYGFDAPERSLREWDRLFFVNERRLRNVVAAGAIDADSPAVRLVGMPKVDALVDGSLERNAVLLDLGLDPARPTVLYAPTWSPASSLNRVGVDLVRRLLARRVNVIVKLHDRSRDLRPQFSGGVDWAARLQPLLTPPQGVLAPRANITPCLAAADVMITDHSSCGFEYLLLDRPLVRIDVPELLAQANIHSDYVALLAEASLGARDAAGAAAAVDRALA